MSNKKLPIAMDIANWWIYISTRQELEQYCFDRMVDELSRASEAKLSKLYQDMLKAKQEMQDAQEPTL
jgi:hypothetical protein